jgi:hypothetical protein
MAEGSEQVRALAGEGGSQYDRFRSVMAGILKDDRLALAARKVM